MLSYYVTGQMDRYIFMIKMKTVASHFWGKFAVLKSVYFAGILEALFLIINQIKPVCCSHNRLY